MNHGFADRRSNLATLAMLLLVGLAQPRPVAALEKPNAANAQFQVATALQNRHAYQQAIPEWIRFIDTYHADPRLDRGFYCLGVCYLKTNLPKPGAESFQIVIEHFPQSDLIEASYLNLGLCQIGLARPAQAESYDPPITTLRRLATLFPKGNTLPQAMFCLGECYYAQHKKQEAARMYSHVVDNYPDHELAVTALYDLGVAQQELEQQEAAARTLDRFLEKYPANPLVPEIHLRRGEIAFTAGQYQAAARHFAATSAGESPLADRATIRQAAALEQLRQPARAAAVYQSLPARFPKSPLAAAASLAGGRCHYQAGNFAQAQAALGRALSDPATAAEATHWLARSLLKLKQPAAALAAVEKAPPRGADGPWGVQLLLDRADALYELPARRGDAISTYAGLAAAHPRDSRAPQALYMAGFTALGTGDYAAALKYAQAFSGQYRDHELVPDVTYVAAESLLQLGRSSEARKLYDALLRTYPAHADAPAWKVRRGLSLYLEKDYAGTIAFLQPQLTEIRHLDTLAEACYLVGASQAELKQFPAAIRSLEASLAAQPRWRQADETLLVLAYAYRHEDRLDQAIACLGRLIQQFPASGARQRAHFRLAEYAYAAHDLATAARHYQEVLDHPGQAALAPHALLGLAWTRLDGNAFAAAEEAAGTLLAKYPADKLAPRAHYVRGMARQQLRKFAPALDDLRAFLASQPGGADKSDARYVTALCQVGLQRGADAAATLENLLREEPAYAGGDKALYELAWAEQSLHREREAAEAFRRLAQGHPHSPLAAESGFLAAEFDYRQGHFAAAAEGYRRAITVAGITAIGEKAAHRLGWACFRQNDFAAAQQAFARQCAAWPDGPLASDAAFMQAESLGKLGRFAEALAAYDAVKHPRGEDFGLLALVHGAAAAAQSAQWEKSRDWCLRAGQQFPDTKYLPEILYQQAWAQQNLGHLDEALRLYAQAIAKSNPDFPDCAEFAARSQFMIGQVHARQGQFAEALKSFNNVVYGYSYPKWTAEATYEAARCYEKLGKKAEAIGAYEKLLADHPGSDKAAPAKARLAELKR